MKLLWKSFTSNDQFPKINNVNAIVNKNNPYDGTTTHINYYNHNCCNYMVIATLEVKTVMIVMLITVVIMVLLMYGK